MRWHDDPIVAETSIALEPVTRDDFADSLPGVRGLEPPSQRDLVIVSPLLYPKFAAELRGTY